MALSILDSILGCFSQWDLQFKFGSMDKKLLLVISENIRLVQCIKDNLSLNYEICVEHSIHSAYSVAVTFLPQIIFMDTISIQRKKSKKIKAFKSTHFLKKTWLILYCEHYRLGSLQNKHGVLVNEFLTDELTYVEVCQQMISRGVNSAGRYNYWNTCFMGLFNLMSNPILLLHKNKIIAMNDAFRNIFKIGEEDGLHLTDFIMEDERGAMKASLHNFSRGKHVREETKTVLLLSNDKLRNAKVSLSKLSRDFADQFLLFIDFLDGEVMLKNDDRKSIPEDEKCFDKNEKLEEFEFTKREKEIIELLCQGYKTKEISETLFISPKTIEKHRSNIIKRTNSETILESVIYAIKHNLVSTRGLKV